MQGRVVRFSASEAVRTVNMLPMFKSNNLFKLPHRGHRNVPVGTLDVRFVHDKLDMVTMSSVVGA